MGPWVAGETHEVCKHFSMATNEPMWKTLVQAAADLKDSGDGDFSWSDLMKRARTLDPSHSESAFGPVFQSMVIESPTPAATPIGKVFTRVSRGTYELQVVPDGIRSSAPKLFEESVVRSITQTPTQRDVRHRTLQLAANFDAYVTHFQWHVPFTKPRELSLHRLTNDRRRELGSVEAALNDEAFLDSLFATLILRGIGPRGTKLVPRAQFGATLLAHRDEISEMERFSIEDACLDVTAVAERLSALSRDLGIVENVATVEPGSKALHYLLPNLVPPLDRRWSGKFFRWGQQDPLAHSQRLWIDALTNLALVASATTPSRLLDDEWNSSAAQILDNALIGYCQVELKTAIELSERSPSEAMPTQVLQFNFIDDTSPDSARPTGRRHWFQFWKSTRRERVQRLNLGIVDGHRSIQRNRALPLCSDSPLNGPNAQPTHEDGEPEREQSIEQDDRQGGHLLRAIGDENRGEASFDDTDAPGYEGQ